MTGPDDDIGDEGAGAAIREGWTTRRVPAALGAASDAVLAALAGVAAMAAAEARRDAEARLADLRAEVGDELASIQASMGRIRSALATGASSTDRDATAVVLPGAPKPHAEAHSALGTSKVVEPAAGALPTGSEGMRPDARPEQASEPAGRPRRANQAAKEQPGIGAGSVPPEVDAGIEAILRTGEFDDWRDAAVALLREALAARAAARGDAPVSTEEQGSNLEAGTPGAARPDTPPVALNGASHPLGGSAGRAGIP